jgi:hypothetical protein
MRKGHHSAEMDERARLLLFSDVVGTGFGTEDFCLFLYSLVRLHAPRILVELGTGLGASAFWMALAAKRNGVGHVWTVDDLELFKRDERSLDNIISKLRRTQFASLEASTGRQYFQELSRLLDLDKYLTFVHEKIALDEERHFDRYPFANETIDLLFSDFKHGPVDILAILGHFLPRMSPASSILIDSAPTAWSSYLLLEQLIIQLNKGQVPMALQERSSSDLSEVMRNRRILLVHLTEWKERHQNSTAWLKIEPIDLLPQPRTYMHEATLVGLTKEQRITSIVQALDARGEQLADEDLQQMQLKTHISPILDDQED